MTLFPEPQLLRVFLLLGLVVHKGLWEALKKQRPPRKPGPRRRPLPAAKVVLKLGKAGVLAFLLSQVCFLDIFPIVDEPLIVQVVGTFVYAFGLLMAVIARVQLGSNWADLEDFAILDKQALVTNGVYKYVRHPIYAGDLLLLTGLELALNCWLVVCVVVPLFVVLRQISKEEALLLQYFPHYGEYRRRSKRLIPFLL